MNPDCIIKLVVVGDSGVGKSSMMIRFTDDTFSDSFIGTIGVDFRTTNMHLRTKFAKVQIWDTAGQERFRTITASYYRGSHGAIIVYDITDRASFLHVQHWLDEIQRHGSDNMIVLVVGNKSDRGDAREVSFEEAAEFTTSRGVRLVETSAKTSDNIDLAFETLCQDVVDAMPELPPAGHTRCTIPRSTPLFESQKEICCNK